MAANPAIQQYQKQLNDVLDTIDDKLQRYPIVQQVSAQAKVRPAYLAVGLVVFAIAFIFWGFGGRLVANLVGFGYPLYESFGSLKRKPAPGVVDEEDTQWLTYWVVYSTFTLLESFSSFLENLIPFYHLVKIAFLCWCFLPQTQGALLIYHGVIEPILVRYEGKIDAGSSRVKKSASEVADDLAEAGGAALEHKKKELMDSVVNNLTASASSGLGGGNVAAPGGPSHNKSQ